MSALVSVSPGPSFSVVVKKTELPSPVALLKLEPQPNPWVHVPEVTSAGDPPVQR